MLFSADAPSIFPCESQNADFKSPEYALGVRQYCGDLELKRTSLIVSGLIACTVPPHLHSVQVCGQNQLL